MKPAAFAAAVIAAASLAPDAVHACSRAPYKRGEIRLLDRSPADTMVRNAAFVDLAVIESARPFDIGPWHDRALREVLAAGPDDDRPRLTQWQAAWTREFLEERPTRFTFRVLERLKGQGPDRFDLIGLAPEPPPPPPPGRRPWRGHGDADEAFFIDWGGSLAYEDYATSCNDAFRVIDPQARYLIFRDADGRILGPTLRWKYRRGGAIGWSRGPAFSVVTAGDGWLEAVRRAARRQSREKGR